MDTCASPRARPLTRLTLRSPRPLPSRTAISAVPCASKFEIALVRPVIARRNWSPPRSSPASSKSVPPRSSARPPQHGLRSSTPPARSRVRHHARAFVTSPSSPSRRSLARSLVRPLAIVACRSTARWSKSILKGICNVGSTARARCPPALRLHEPWLGWSRDRSLVALVVPVVSPLRMDSARAAAASAREFDTMLALVRPVRYRFAPSRLARSRRRRFRLHCVPVGLRGLRPMQWGRM